MWREQYRNDKKVLQYLGKVGKLWSMAQSHNVQHFCSVRVTVGRLAYSVIVTGNLYVFGSSSCLYFFNSIILTSYKLYAFFFFCFFHSLVALLGIRLHQPDGECFPVLHQPSFLLQEDFQDFLN